MELPQSVPTERPSRLGERERSGFLGWFVFSALVHGIIISSLFIWPSSSFRRAVSYPVYSVELVGGEKLGGESLSTVVTPAPEPKKETQTAKVEPAAKVQEVKKEKQKAKESAAKAPPTVALKKAKTESKKEEQKKEEGLPGEVREKLIQAALERVKERATTESKKEVGEKAGSGPGEGSGAAAPGQGGGGGGIVKGVDFLIYRNRMLQVIKESWAWVGKRSDLEVIVRFSVQENGEIIRLKIVQPSGDPSYDDSVVRAVRKSSPLPPPPENYRKDFMDVELSFRPKDLRS